MAKIYLVFSLCMLSLVFPFQVEGSRALPAFRYPTPHWNTNGETATTHIFVAGIPVATVEVSAAGNAERGTRF